ncbi:DUF2207 domain-containing protein [Leucobacter sp. cx-328]|uniref:DUF2207 domain-containing protein n=1 Tax=unclassified Leucobacter TaxID=2621730 RepID=UPI00165DB201|nr:MULTISPECIES: DUF2207 domain-containing protein [unclassified Leucobacter]MBC9944004.1 DUF2207 domain-containing protein [Leucobacter sp. cx-328]
MPWTRFVLTPVLLLAASSAAIFGGSAPASADVDDFSYSSWSVDYRITQDDDGRALTHVTETLVAQFPEVDQNRGIVRGLPMRYEKAAIDPRDFTVTDEHGAAVPFDTEVDEDGDFIAVLTGNNDYVHGSQTYIIDYTLSDTILARDDGTADEFYWDLVDFEHRQQIDAFQASITVDPTIASALNGNTACYVGVGESTQRCDISHSGATFSVTPVPLAAHEGVTVAIGFAPGTFTQPPVRLPNALLDTVPFVTGGLAALLSLGSMFVGMRYVRKRRVDRGTIIAQYDVPRNLPPLLAAKIAGRTSSTVPAEFVHLAVNGAIRIEDDPKKPGSRSARPTLRLVSHEAAVDALDGATLNKLFGSAAPGASKALPKKDEKFGASMQKLTEAGSKQAHSRGYFEKRQVPLARMLAFISMPIAAVHIVLTIMAMVQRDSGASVLFFILAIAAIVGIIYGLVPHEMHTRHGAEAREYLLGVKEFISVAEADRIRVLQSPTGAERREIDQAMVVDLYEKLLPYAMLFGLEKQWTKTLQTKYAETPGYSPLWYPALMMHGGIDRFASEISRFTDNMSSSVSYTSSSSGGSSGGGFAGGGGGGGFSGGR